MRGGCLPLGWWSKAGEHFERDPSHEGDRLSDKLVVMQMRAYDCPQLPDDPLSLRRSECVQSQQQSQRNKSTDSKLHSRQLSRRLGFLFVPSPSLSNHRYTHRNTSTHAHACPVRQVSAGPHTHICMHTHANPTVQSHFSALPLCFL